MDIKTGDYIRTPRFLQVCINEVIKCKKEMWQAGYTEPTHYRNDEWEINGKSIDMYHMKFAACRK